MTKSKVFFSCCRRFLASLRGGLIRPSRLEICGELLCRTAEAKLTLEAERGAFFFFFYREVWKVRFSFELILTLLTLESCVYQPSIVAFWRPKSSLQNREFYAFLQAFLTLLFGCEFLCCFRVNFGWNRQVIFCSKAAHFWINLTLSIQNHSF